MARELILHIGQPKTGSTSIQKTLASAQAALEQTGVLYPNSSIINYNHRALGPAIFRRAAPGLYVLMGGNDEAVLQASSNEWDSVCLQSHHSSCSTVLLSSEGFFQELFPERKRRLLERLDQIPATSVRVIGYVRSPVSFYLSTIQQNIQGGRDLTSPVRLNYVNIIKSYQNIFGEQFELGAFERRQLRDEDVVSDFLHRIGYPEMIRYRPTEDENQSVSAEALSALAQLRPKRTPRSRDELKKQNQLANLVRRYDSELPNPTSLRLGQRLKDTLLSLNSEMLLALRDEHNITFSDIHYDDIRKGGALNTLERVDVDDICEHDPYRCDHLKSLVLKKMKR